MTERKHRIHFAHPLSRGRRVLVANAPALEILRRGDGLLDEDGTLRASLPSDQKRMQKLLERALPQLWGEAPDGGSMTVQRPSRQTTRPEPRFRQPVAVRRSNAEPAWIRLQTAFSFSETEC